MLAYSAKLSQWPLVILVTYPIPEKKIFFLYLNIATGVFAVSQSTALTGCKVQTLKASGEELLGEVTFRRP